MMGRRENARDRSAAVLLATFSLATSVLLNAGVLCSNDGSQYALTRAFVDDGSAVIDDYIAYTFEMDYARMGDHSYSDRPPGVAFLASPLYVFARAVGLDDVGRQTVVTLLASFAGALSVVLLFYLARRLGAMRFGAIVAALTLALATPHRSYSAALFSHAISSVLVIGVAHLVLPGTWADAGRRRFAQLLAGLLGGYACGVDYSNGLPVVVLCVTGAVLEGQGAVKHALSAATVYLIGGVIGVTPTLAYHTAVFGAPWSIAYHYDVNFAHTHTVGGMYGGNWLTGLYALTFSPAGGMIFWSPVLLLALVAIPRFYRDAGRRALVVILPWLALFFVTCLNVTPEGGASRDIRYLMAVLPLIVLPVAWAFDWARGRGRAFTVAAGSVLVISAVVQAVKHHALWVRNGEPWIEHLKNAWPDTFAATLLGFLRWAAPHPIAALVLVVLGLLVARWLSRPVVAVQARS